MTNELYLTLTTVIVFWVFLESHSKAKCTRAPTYSRALRRIKGIVQRVVHGNQMHIIKFNVMLCSVTKSTRARMMVSFPSLKLDAMSMRTYFFAQQ